MELTQLLSYIILMFKLICLIVLAFVACSFSLGDNLCPHDVEVTCVSDINKGIALFI